MVSIPSGVFTTYKTFADALINDLGVQCTLVYPEKLTEVSSADNPTTSRSINAHRRGGRDAYKRGDKIIKPVETTETIKLRVYWRPRDWINTGFNMEIPDNYIQTIGYLTDLPKLRKAEKIIVNANLDGYGGDSEFQRASEHYTVGLQQDRYIAMFWERV
jgi:hypothetical protein